MDYQDSEIDDTLDWVKEQQKQNSRRPIGDRIEQEMEILKNG